MKPHTLSDGTFLPPGTFVSAASRAIHFDSEHYENPEVFDGFRFADPVDSGRMNELGTGNGEEPKNHMVTTSSEYLPFGHGKHAWFVNYDFRKQMAQIKLSFTAQVASSRQSRLKRCWLT